MGNPALAPLSGWTDAVLLVARLVLAAVMLHYGWPKARDPAKNARDFSRDGFRPGWLFGSLVLVTELGGGLLVLLGAFVWIAAIAFGFEMLVGTITKATKWRQPFTDYSYDLVLLGLCLLLLGFGPGAFRV